MTAMPDTDHTHSVCVVLHDVAPPSWPLYESMVHELDRTFDIPLTLLVVPDYHHQGLIEDDTFFIRAMAGRLTRGDELVLHGYHHEDPGPAPLQAKEYFMRRIYTHEGEFYRISEAEAARRLQQGLNMFRRLGWPVSGFVAPAWLTGSGTRNALRRFPFRYTSDPAALIRLPEYSRQTAPTLVWSAGSSWRRLLSMFWNDYRLACHRDAPLLRLGLHPVDMLHPFSRNYWLRTLTALLKHRTAVTKQQWLQATV